MLLPISGEMKSSDNGLRHQYMTLVRNVISQRKKTPYITRTFVANGEGRQFDQANGGEVRSDQWRPELSERQRR